VKIIRILFAKVLA